MRQGKIFWSILKRTHADKIVTGFGMYFLISALVIMLAEPGIHRYGESIWYCFSVITTIGFGDFTAVTVIGRTASIILGLYGVIVLAIIPGIVATYYMEVVNFKNGDSGEALSLIHILLVRDKEFSEKENRMLEQKPKLSWTGIESGRYMKQYESYKSDQFAGRNFWVAFKTRVDLIAGRRESNGVFKGEDVYKRQYLYSLAFTVAFSFIVNGVMYFKLRKIDMVESLKSVE